MKIKSVSELSLPSEVAQAYNQLYVNVDDASLMPVPLIRWHISLDESGVKSMVQNLRKKTLHLGPILSENSLLDEGQIKSELSRLSKTHSVSKDSIQVVFHYLKDFYLSPVGTKAKTERFQNYSINALIQEFPEEIIGEVNSTATDFSFRILPAKDKFDLALRIPRAETKIILSTMGNIYKSGIPNFHLSHGVLEHILSLISCSKSISNTEPFLFLLHYTSFTVVACISERKEILAALTFPNGKNSEININIPKSLLTFCHQFSIDKAALLIFENTNQDPKELKERLLAIDDKVADVNLKFSPKIAKTISLNINKLREQQGVTGSFRAESNLISLESYPWVNEESFSDLAHQFEKCLVNYYSHSSEINTAILLKSDKNIFKIVLYFGYLIIAIALSYILFVGLNFLDIQRQAYWKLEKTQLTEMIKKQQSMLETIERGKQADFGLHSLSSLSFQSVLLQNLFPPGIKLTNVEFKSVFEKKGKTEIYWPHSTLEVKVALSPFAEERLQNLSVSANFIEVLNSSFKELKMPLNYLPQSPDQVKIVFSRTPSDLLFKAEWDTPLPPPSTEIAK